ncbi:VanZ family protein [Holdemania filiformis]|uniref:VanZ family protein n=1 Tax=Holdemania filiformis TaxID=61171 RepID=UPI00242E0115|nr:VanZ family protein [Holdemania filiformis]
MNLFSGIGLWLAGSAFLVFLCARFVSRMNFKLKRVSLLLGTGAWLFFVFSVTLNGPYSAKRFHNWNLIPFQGIGEIAGTLQSGKVNGFYLTLMIRQELANILMFLPGGFLIAAAFPQFRNWRRILIFGAGCSLTIEVIQFLIGRIADVDDVLMNSFGAVLGFVLFQFSGLGFRKIRSFFAQKETNE